MTWSLSWAYTLLSSTALATLEPRPQLATALLQFAIQRCKDAGLRYKPADLKPLLQLLVGTVAAPRALELCCPNGCCRPS